MSAEDRPIFPTTPLTTDELRLRHGQGKKTFKLPDPDYAKGARIRPLSGKTCKCGSVKVHRFSVEGSRYLHEYACFDCWRHWREYE